MTNLPGPRRPAGELLASLRDRRTTRAVERIHAVMYVKRAAHSAEARLAHQRITDIGALTKHAIEVADDVAIAEQWSAWRTPHAAARRIYLAETGTAKIGAVLTGLEGS
jgi:hypothetical protein